MSSSRNGLIGLGIGLGVAGAAAAAGFVADRTHRRRQDALETGVSLVEEPSRELVVEATDGVALHVEVDEPKSGDGIDELGLPQADRRHVARLLPDVGVLGVPAALPALGRVPRRRLGPARSRPVGTRRAARPTRSPSSGEDLTAVIEAAAPEGPLVLVGHSMGGMTTMALGATHPGPRPRAGVAFGAISTSAGGMPLASGGFAASAGRLLLERLGPDVAGVFEHRPELLKGILSANSELAEFLVERYSFSSPVPRSVVMLASKMLLGTNLTVMSTFTPAFDDYDQTGGLAAFDGCETLVFNGEQDILTPPEHSERIVRALAGAQHVIVRDAGHVIMLEHPDLLNQQLHAMIERAAKREDEHMPADLSRGSAGRHRRRQEAPDRARAGADGQRRRRPERQPERARCAERPHAGASPRGVVSRDGLPSRVSLASADDTHAFGMRLGRLLRAGDLVVLTGGLGAGKTTLTQGIGAGLGVRGPVTSPTFVIARVHPSPVGGPAAGARRRLPARRGARARRPRPRRRRG